MKCIRDLMMKKVVVVTAETPLVDAIKIMQEKKIGAIVVLDNLKLAGIFTERDLIAKFFMIIEQQNIKELKISDVMTKNLITVSPDQVYTDSLKYMQVKGIRHLPVVEEDSVIGVLSIRDLLEQVILDYQKNAPLEGGPH